MDAGVPGLMRKCTPMNAEQIRAAFIDDQLNRVRTQSNRLRALRIVRELRRYFTWCAGLLTETHRQRIAARLSQLETDLKQRC